MTATGTRKALLGIVTLILAFKLWLSAVFPFTGDEAYFVYWGTFPDYGYYDHPPMIGWLLYLLLKLSHAEWVLRLPATLLPFALAAGVYLIVRRADEMKAALATLAFLLLPANVWDVFITTDTPLVFFCFASAFAFWQGIARRSPGWQALAGVFLGLAFLSKYFAVLLGLVYIAYVCFSPRGQRDWRALGLVVLCSLPFAAVNTWWNYEHCWANLMFNVYNRHENAGWSWKTPLVYAVSVLYLLSPVALWQLAKGRRALSAALGEPSVRFFVVALAFPFGFFALLSPVKLIGLHWMLAFVPFFFVAAGLLLSREQLRSSVLYLGVFSVVHVVLIAGASMFPLETWKTSKWTERLYDGIVYHARMREILRDLEPYEGEFEFAADGYSIAAVAFFHSRRPVVVFGEASSHARHDDILTDFRRLDGKNILVLRKTLPVDADYRPYFRSVEYRELTQSGATFHIVLGRGFDFAAYREGVLAPLRARFYAIPWYLPQGRCYFCDRYFGAATCPAKD
ncbi:MAG TPA: glycosyltransferase family 39 protein [Burkholderiales bacterium]|nr:glycosyltransferase family 39 protein [Burkholderiales bacterium]